MAYVILSVNRYLAIGFKQCNISLATGTKCNTQNAAFPLNQTTSLLISDWSSNQTRVVSSITLTISCLLPAATITSATTARRNTRRHALYLPTAVDVGIEKVTVDRYRNSEVQQELYDTVNKRRMMSTDMSAVTAFFVVLLGVHLERGSVIGEDYDDWKIRMQAHLAALDDEMWVVLTEGPLKIMKPNLAFAISNASLNSLRRPDMSIQVKIKRKQT
ncbi:hypothetical protein F511_18004 [Dorcoceras hygrometricum]|uniref:Uncharacterized protein n=1 Tax=Dorcoceras hygrometricum TaxID=472368 RepID=A0A2Z7DFK3_9LAMI|nr:hypothetical protein F511_18004 [Dorcoceras hygrometricum]